MEDITFQPATAADLTAIRALLDRCALPTEDLTPSHLEHFVVCRAGPTLAGTVGLELLGPLALLRSLAVAPEMRGKRLGHELWLRARDEARRRGVQRLYLLTTTAEGLFSRWGFQRVARDAVPPPVRETREFSSVCPSTAVAMALDLAASGVQRPRP